MFFGRSSRITEQQLLTGCRKAFSGKRLNACKKSFDLSILCWREKGRVVNISSMCKNVFKTAWAFLIYFTPPNNTRLWPKYLGRCGDCATSTDPTPLSCPRQAPAELWFIHPSPRTGDFFPENIPFSFSEKISFSPTEKPPGSRAPQPGTASPWHNGAASGGDRGGQEATRAPSPGRGSPK